MVSEGSTASVFNIEKCKVPNKTTRCHCHKPVVLALTVVKISNSKIIILE